MAFDLGIAALVSKEIYNFGELVTQIPKRFVIYYEHIWEFNSTTHVFFDFFYFAKTKLLKLTHPIAESLSSNPELGWITEVLYAVNSGNITSFNNIKEKYKTKIENTHALKNTMPHIKEKIAIMALVELIFSKPSDERVIPFSDLASGTQLPTDQVELLVMKALSLGLIKGSIDEVDQAITIKWVQPRVLDMSQISKMDERLQKWTGNVSQLLTFIQNETAPELLI